MKFSIFIFILFNLISCGQKASEESNRTPNINTTNLEDSTGNNILRSPKIQGAVDKKTKPRKVELTRNWLLVEGHFPDKNLTFKRTEKEDYVFIFQEDGTIDYRTNKGFGDCPVGAFTLKKGEWKKEGPYLTLELRGLKISDYWYWWKVQYKIDELTTDNLKLELVNIIKNKKVDPTLTWDDLIKD